MLVQLDLVLRGFWKTTQWAAHPQWLYMPKKGSHTQGKLFMIAVL